MSVLKRPSRHYDYVDSGPAIYVDSFATIRRETALDGLPPGASTVAVRMVHGTGQTDLVDDLVFHPDLVPAARAALEAGAPILADAQMVASGVTRARLPKDNEVVCLLCDRDLDHTGVDVEFFGERTTLPAGPATAKQAVRTESTAAAPTATLRR